MKTKLTLVSVSFQGRQRSIFVHAPIIDGKATVSEGLINKMLESLSCYARGLTYSIG